MSTHPAIVPDTHTATRHISILGATGSIGQNTLDVVRQHKEHYSIGALTAHKNTDQLIALAKEFQPELAVITDETQYQTVKSALAGSNIEVATGNEGLRMAASLPVDWCMAAIVGMAGLEPTLEAIKQGNTIAFASKECLVSAGQLMMQACHDHGTTLLPVDSEHNAIFQVFAFEQTASIESITLTASGGPFRTRPINTFTDITPQEAVNHPNWSMGAKISVDSATMMNKGLELIEAFHLFPLEADQIDIIIHPESVIHSLVHYTDGSVLAQLGMPDMRTPIAYTLGWPKRIHVESPRLNLTEIAALHFEPPDHTLFPALTLCRNALKSGQAACIALNAANEIAVASFLNRKLPYINIIPMIETLVETMGDMPITTLDDVLSLDKETRIRADEYMKG